MSLNQVLIKLNPILMKKPLLLTILTFLFINFSNAQTFDWVKSTTSINANSSLSVGAKYDQSGNIINIGFIKDSIRFDSLFNKPKILYGDGVYILKTDSNSTALWLNSIDIKVLDFDLDLLGNIYIIGFYFDTIDIDPGINTIILPPDPARQSNRSHVVLKVNNSGDLIWAKNISGNYLISSKIVVDETSNIYIATNFDGIINIDPSLTGAVTFTHPNTMSVFKWDANGNYIWGKAFGQYVDLTSIAIKKDQLTLTGSYKGTVDFDPDPNKMFYKTSALNSNDPFALTLNTNGNFKWFLDYRRANVEGFGNVSIDENKNSYFSSILNSSNDFDPGPNQVILTPTNSKDLFILKFDSSGKFSWVKQIEGLKASNQIISYRNVIGPSGDFYLVCSFKGHYDLNPGVNINSINSGNNYSLFTLRLSNNGDFKSLVHISSTDQLQLKEFDVGIRNNLIYSCEYAGSIDFDPTTTVYNYTATSFLREAFLLQYNQCFETYGNLQANDCHFYQSPFSSKLWQTSGIYTDTTSNYMGCDSVVSINVQLSNINNTMGLLGSSLASNDFGATYQWLNCDSNYSVIANEIGQLFTPNKNGNYAVELTKNNCKDTSACFSYTLVSQKELSLAHSVLVSPNPSKGLYNVVASSGYDRLIITDLSGRIVYSNSSSLSGAVQIDLSNYENGIYLLTIENKGERVVKKLVKH